MGNFLDKSGLTRFTEKLLDEVDSRISNSSGGNSPTKEEIIEGATRVSDVEVDAEVAKVEALQTGLARIESNLNGIESNLNSQIRAVETWVDGDSFYRKYSDGWIEQGGKVSATEDVNPTVTFPTAFSTVPNVTFGWEKVANMTDSSVNITLYAVTATKFQFHQGIGATMITHWYACGY